MDEAIRHDWKTEEIHALLVAPLFNLLDRARLIHKQYHPRGDVQLASLLSIKTGGCPENCKYCPQSAHFEIGRKNKSELMDTKKVLARASLAKKAGASRFCMGAAWRSVRAGEEFERVLEMVEGVRRLGMEACVTLGMLEENQARRLKRAGLTAYNHNLDTSERFYEKIITTRSFNDRIRTLEACRRADLQLCSGGIIGMGESDVDRAELLRSLSRFAPHPESVPINALEPVEGTPMGDREPIEPMELVRMCAAARIVMPASRIRLSAGRSRLSREAQTLCFLAGANSVFYGEKLLTTRNNDCAEDMELLAELGLEGSDENKKQQKSLPRHQVA